MEAVEHRRQDENDMRRKVAKRDILPESPKQDDETTITPTEEELTSARPMQEIKDIVSQLASQVSQLMAQMTQLSSRVAKMDTLEANVNQLLLAHKTRKGVPYVKTSAEGNLTAMNHSLSQDGAPN